MIVIARHTEKKLLQELALSRRQNRSQRCYYLPLSLLDDMPRDTVFVPLLTLFHKVPNSYMAQLFICNDRDTFIFISDLSLAAFNEFLDEFTQALGRPDFARKAHLYEVGRDHDALSDICQRKSALAQQLQAEEARRVQIAHVGKMLEELTQLRPELLETLQQRRAERAQAQVLLVDDDQLCRTLAANVLSKKFGCVQAKTSKEALLEYVKTAPDAMFLDIGLPDISGFDLLEQLFAVDANAYVIMFSGRKDKENILRALEMGAQGFVGKPFSGQQLLEYVRKSPFVQEKEDRLNKGRQGVA